MVELLFPRTLTRGYERRDLYSLEVSVCGELIVLRFVTLYIMYNTSDFPTCQAPIWERFETVSRRPAYYNFRNDTRQAYPEHNLVASEPTAALQGINALFQMNPHREALGQSMHCSLT